MRRIMCVAVSGVVAAVTALAIAAPAEAAAPRVEITKVFYDSPGTDRGSNDSLNHEWVRLTNRRSYTINLRGWTLRDKANHIYTFRNDFNLQAGANVYIHTGQGTSTSVHRYWGRGSYVWNNTGDKAYLRAPGGTLVDACSWAMATAIPIAGSPLVASQACVPYMPLV
jgi:hypothetical protein